MEGTGIVAVIALVLNLIYFFAKRKDSPETVRKRILEGAKDDLEKMDNAVARGDWDDVTRLYADLRRGVLLKTTHSGDSAGENRKD